MKKIKKRMISAVLALSMGMTLMPTDFTGFRAYATNEAESGTANQRTNGKYVTMLGTTDDPSFGSAIINKGLTDPTGPYYSTGLSYGCVNDATFGTTIYWQISTGKQSPGADFNYDLFDRKSMYCVDAHTGDVSRNVFNNGFSKGLLKLDEDGDLVDSLTGEIATPIKKGDQKFTTNMLIALLGYQSDLSDITDGSGFYNINASNATVRYETYWNIKSMIWNLATDGDQGMTGDWATDYAYFKSGYGNYNELGTCTDPLAYAMGCRSGSDELFFKCWVAAKMNSDMTFNDDAMTKNAVSMTTNADGSTVAVYSFGKELVQAGIQNYLDVQVDGGTYTWNMADGTLVVTAPAGIKVSGTVTAKGLSWDGRLSTIPNFATADICRLYYASIPGDIDEDDADAVINGMEFGASQNFMSVIFSGDYSFQFGKDRPTTESEVTRHKHEESWNADYNVRLAKFDSETGKALEGSHFDILEKFDDSQLDNTHLEFNFGDVQGGLDAGSLNQTDWGDDTVEDNYSGEFGVVASDDNYRNWANDNGSQFEKWTDEKDDPCTKDDEVTAKDGFLGTNGTGESKRAHNDTRSYTYKKGYCDGHPAPEIEYVEAEGDEDVDEINQQIHDEAWAKWFEDVQACVELANEGGFFHAIDPGAAKEALEEDRDQFYKDFTSLTYEYSAEETRARTGYILHGLHTDDIPVEWRTVTSSQYKDWTSRGALNHAGANDAGGDDEAEGIDGYALDTASVIDDNVENEEKYVDTIQVSAKDEKTTEAYEKAVDEYVENTASESNKETNEETAENEETVSSEDSEKKKVDETEVNETEVNETAADASTTTPNDNKANTPAAEIDTVNSEDASEGVDVATPATIVRKKIVKASPSEVIDDDDEEYDVDDEEDIEEDIAEEDEDLVEGKDSEFSVRAIFSNVKNFFIQSINAVANVLGISSDDDEDTAGGSGTLWKTVTDPSEANTISPDKDNIVDWTFIVYDHRTEGEIHINKKDFNLNDDTSDTYDAYADENGDGTLEGAVYGLFAQTDIVHPDGKTNVVYKAGDLVAIATTDRNGDASFMTYTEAPGTHYNYEKGTTETYEWNANAPKNLHMNEAASAAFSDDIEVFEGHDPDNRKITAGNGADLPDTETGDDTFLWKNSTNQLYNSGKLENNNVTNRKEDTYRSEDTSGHYPISNNEDNNGNCWIGRPLIVSGESTATYYIKELSRSEGYELSVNGKDSAWTNRNADLDDNTKTVTLNASKITSGTSATGITNYNEFNITSNGTNAYHVKLENIYGEPTVYAISSNTVWDPEAEAEGEYVTQEEPQYGNPGAYVYINGNKVKANVGDSISLPNGETATVGSVSSTDPQVLTVQPSNALITEMPTITADDQNATVEDDNIDSLISEYNKKLKIQKVGMASSVAKTAPYFLVELAGTTYQNYFDKLNEAIGSQKLFNSFYVSKTVDKNGKTYAVMHYRYAEGNSMPIVLYDEDSKKIYVKSQVSYKDGDASSKGFIYVPYDESEYEIIEKKDGFVTKAKLSEKKPAVSVIELPNDMSGITFVPATQDSYWVYGAKEQMRDNAGNLITKKTQTYVPKKGAYVTKETNTKVTLTKTADKTYEFDYTVPDDGEHKVVYRLAYANDYYNLQPINALVMRKGIITVTSDTANAETFVVSNETLTYPGQKTIVQDNETGTVPASVEERPIRQQVKISKDVQTLPTTMKVWYCANDGVANSDDVDTCAGCGRKRTVEATKNIDYAHDTYTAFFNEDLSDKKQETNWITRLKNWFATISGVSGSEDTAKAVANFRFKAYLKSNIERLYRDENGKVTFEDRNGNEVTPNYVDTNGDGLYETFTWNTYNGTSDFPEKDKTEDGKILSTNVQKVFTKVEHPTTSYTTSAVANNVWDTYSTPENGADDNVAERNNGATTNQRVKANRSDDAVKTNLSLYSYQNDATNVQKNDWLRDNQNKGYTRILESTERVIEDGTSTRTVQTYNYEKFFDAIAAANTDKWDDDIETCTFNYDGYDTPVGKISMQNYPGQKWENTLKEENQKGDVNNSFDLFRWIHEKIYGSVKDYQKFQDGQGNYGALNGTNTETTTSTSDYARANAEASNAVRQFAVKWYMKDEVAKLVKNNGVGDGEDIAKTEAEGGAPGITEEGVVPYDDYIHDYALFKALQKAYNYLRPFYENDLDTIYSVEWDSAKDGGNDKDVTTLSTDIHEEGAFYNTSSYLPYGVYVIVEQTPSNFSADTGYDLVNRAFNIEKPKEVIVPSLYEGNASDNTTDNYDTHYSFDPALSPDKLAASKYNGGSGYLIRFNEEWPTAENDFDDNHSANGTAEHVIRAHGYYGDFEVFKYGLDVDKNGKEANRAISNNGGYDFRGFTIVQSIFDPLKDYYSVGHNGESKDDAMIKITAAEGGEGDNSVRYPLADLARNNEQTANGTAKYDIDTLINRFYYASVSEDNGRASDVIYKGGAKNDNNASGMQFKDNVKTATGELTAYEGKFAQMLVPWTVTAPADINAYSNADFTGYADVNERDTFKTTTLTIRKVDAETGEQIIHDDTVFGIYAASRYTTENEILADAEKLTGAEKTKFINQFKPGDTKFYMEDTKVYASREFLEAMGAYDISYLVSLDKGKAKRYGENGYKRVTEADIKKILGADGYNKITGTVEYGVYHLDVMSGTSIPDDEEVTWYYSVYNTDSPLCVGTIPKGTPICSEKNAVILQDNFTVNKDENDETRTGMLKAYSSLNDVLMEDEDKAGTTSYHLQNTGYIRTPQPLGSGCYVVAELKTPSGYLRGKPEAHEIYSGVDYYYEGGDMFKKAAMVDYQKRIDLNYSYAK